MLDLVPNIRKHHGIILGELNKEVICIPEKTRFNGNLAVYGASGSKKAWAFCMNMILQCAARKQSLIICDQKSELYEMSSTYLRDYGYTVKVLNLVTPDFLSSLFLSFIFIKLVRYADQKCPGGELSVPVHVLGEELCACGVIPDLSRKISVIRSRNISMSYVFQNLAGLQNRYPHNQWQEILGNCDVTLFLGCTDALTADCISQRPGKASIGVTSKAKQLGAWHISNYTSE